MDRLASMATFVKAADAGSFAAAAVALGMSPQMVAKHVAYLEARLGARLLNRTTRRQSLTEIGRSYYERCRLVLAEAELADSLVDHAKGQPRGRLRINAPVSFGAYRLVPMVTRYLRLYPAVHVDLVLSDRLVDLVEDEFEAVFRIGPPVESNLVARELSPFQFVACAAPVYLEKHGIPHVPLDLDRHECLGFISETGPTASEWCFLRNGVKHEISVRNRFQASNATALLSAALDGFGIAFISEDLARASLLAGELVKVLADFETPSRPMHLLFHADRRQTPKLKSFVDAALKEFGPAGVERQQG